MKSVSCAGGKEDKRMICKNCGAEIRDGALFCRHCGTKVNAGQEGRSGKKRNARTTGNAGQGAGLGQGSLGKGNLTVVLMTLAAAVAVAVISVVCVWMFRKESPEESKEWLEVTGNPAQEEKHPVTLCLYPAMDIRTEEGGQAVPVAGVTAYIWKGTYGTEVSADVKETLTAGEDGMLHADLPLGTYMAQFVSGGYLDTYLEFCVDGDGVSQAAYAVRRPEKGQTIAVLSWEGDGVDLDLTLFAGGQADDMEAPRIGGNLMENGLGDRLVADNDRDCEVMIMHSDGDYSLYVNNYTDSQAGNYESETLSNANARLFLYDEDGFVSAYTIPAGQRGVIWEAAQISGGTVTGGGRVYAELTGGKWWLEDKIAEPSVTVKNIEWEDVGNGKWDKTILYFIFSNDQKASLELLYPSSVDNIEYADINGDGVDEVMVYRYFVNTDTEYTLIDFIEVKDGTVKNISPEMDIDELDGNVWNTSVINTGVEGYSWPVLRMESYGKENGLTFLKNSYLVGYKDGRWQLIQYSSVESSSVASESAEHHFDDTYVEVDWFKSNFLELGMEPDNYVTLNKDDLNTEGLVEMLPEWARIDLIFYPDDSEFILPCFAVARKIYGEGISFEETDASSKFAYEDGYVLVYKVDNVDICFVFNDGKVYVYPLDIEKSIE